MTSETSTQPVELAIVMPVYNEEACIGEVIADWLKYAESTGVGFRLIVVNDGSKDATEERLKSFSHDARLIVISKPNEGHGPSILKGYAEAVKLGEWVFQVDSDNEIPASAFTDLWSRRHSHDFLFGIRTGRQQIPVRAWISRMSRLVVGVWCGRAVRDVNVPYRLMRAELLKSMLPMIPPGTFAPNLAISGLAARFGYRISNIPLPYNGRKVGNVSLFQGRLFRNLSLSLSQTVRILSRCRKR